MPAAYRITAVRPEQQQPNPSPLLPAERMESARALSEPCAVAALMLLLQMYKTKKEALLLLSWVKTLASHC